MSGPRTRARRPPVGEAFDRLVDVMAILRSPQGCAWDRKQTHQSLRPYLLEETYEALDAIDRGDMSALCDELGDVLLQVVFHAELGASRRRFTIRDVIRAVTAKLIRRHPHVFSADGRPLAVGDRRRAAASTPTAVKEQWQRIKAAEGSSRRQRSSGVLAGLPPALPALARASKIGSRVAAVGFDWPRTADVIDKIEEETRELRHALGESDARVADEMGDLLFSIANLARKLKVDPETALRQANDKFTRRFEAVERYLARRAGDVHRAKPAQLEAARQAGKARETHTPSVARVAKVTAGRSPSTTSGRQPSSRRRARRRSR